eukprot:15327679-Ditylum_brightwellii.AAC.1
MQQVKKEETVSREKSSLHCTVGNSGQAISYCDDTESGVDSKRKVQGCIKCTRVSSCMACALYDMPRAPRFTWKSSDSQLPR